MDRRIECLQPARGNRFDAVQRTRQHAGDGAGGIGIAAAIDHVHQAMLESVRIHQRLQHGLHRLHDPAAGVLAPPIAVGKLRKTLDGRRDAATIDVAQRAAGQEIAHREDDQFARRVRHRIVVGDVRLRMHRGANLALVPRQRRQRHRENAHRRAVARVVFGWRCLGVAGTAKGDQVAADGIPDIHGFAAHPAIEGPRAGQRAHLAGIGQDGTTKRQRHGRVVGHLPRLEVEPAPAAQFAMHPVLAGDLARRQEFDGRPQGIADGQPEIGRLGTGDHVGTCFRLLDRCGSPVMRPPLLDKQPLKQAGRRPRPRAPAPGRPDDGGAAPDCP